MTSAESSQAALDAIQRFVLLAREARRRPLPMEDRTQLANLDEELRDVIDGAHPAPKRIGAPTSGSAPIAPASTGSAKVEVRPSTGPNSSPTVTAHEVFSELTASKPPETPPYAVRLLPKDARKLNNVGIEELGDSGYTFSRKPAFLDAYYEDAIEEVVPNPNVSPRLVVDTGGEPIDLPSRTRDLWNLGAQVEPEAKVAMVDSAVLPQKPIEPPDAELSKPTSPTEPALPARSDKGTDGLPPAIVHLLDGETRRGFVSRFDARAGQLRLVTKSDKSGEDIRLEDILVIFFGRRPNAAPSKREGTPVDLVLVNERRLVGVSPDYQPNGSALTVVPDAERGGVDRVWVPAWSVKAISVG